MSSYEPERACEELGIHVERLWLRDTWGAWLPQHHAIVIAHGLSGVQERCVLAHEVEHARAADVIGCGQGPFAERSATQRKMNLAGVRQERAADLRAARRLIPISDLAPLAQWSADPSEIAAELRVTERMLHIRIEDLDGEGWPWPATSKIAG